MKKNIIYLIAVMLMSAQIAFAQESEKKLYLPNAPVPAKYKVDTRIDNMGYWRRMASLGLVPVASESKAPFGKYTGSQLVGRSVATDDSPDVPVTTVTSTQSENSIFVNPNNPEAVLNSNNSTSRPVSGVYGANDFWSTDAGNTWGGEVQGAGGGNSGDPSTAIGLNGWYYVGYIHSSGGQGVSYSTDQGSSWTPVLVAPAPSGFSSLLDKNHMWIDNSPTSPHEGNLYDAWTNFGGANDTEIEISRSTDQGLTWSSAVNISSAVNAGSHNQGVNIQTGPNGEVYVVWAIYDSWPSDETVLAMAKSLDGGATWQPATRIISNIKGIRNSGVSKNMRVNSFPSMTVDISNGPNRGAIYVVWANVGVPGINTGSDRDIYVIKSTDQGATWSVPLKVNQDEPGLGKHHYMPWIACDAVNGNLSVIYYDDRNVSSTRCETYVSNSIDGGATWEDLKVSDVSFVPQPISGLASDYFGDYLAIHAHDRWVYPAWTDNRSGYAMTYVSAFQAGPPPNQPWLIYNTHELDDASGNNNNQLDFGESALIGLSLENIGDQPAQDVHVTLSTASPYITISDDAEAFGDFAVGEIKAMPGAFAIDVLNNVPDGENIVFTITSIDVNDSTFTSNFSITAYAPALQAGAFVIDDNSGDGDGRLDAAETVIVSISTSNPGSFAAEQVAGQLTSASPFITINEPSVELGDIEPGFLNAVSAQFEVTVAPETPVGHSATFNYTASSAITSTSKSYNSIVGIILEDWESGGFESFDWAFAGSADWVIDTQTKYEGLNSSKSGDINNSQVSEMKVTYNVMNNDTISFFRKVSSEDSYDFLKFYVNNTLRGQWSGEEDWQQVKYDVQPGQQTFRWVYSKDVSVISGSDCAWVDFIIFPAPLQTTAFAGVDMATCENSSAMLNGEATNYVSASWASSGDGTFDDNTQLLAFYTPGITDLEVGEVTLTLTVNGPDGELRTDALVLSISTPAIADAGLPQTVCAGTGVQLNGTGENYQSLLWTTPGDGTFDDATTLNPVYTPGESDILNGEVILNLIGLSAAPCSDALDQVTLTLNPAPTAAITGDTTICSGAQLQLSIALTGAAPWDIEIDNLGSFTAEQDVFVTEVSPTETTTYSITSVIDANGCQAAGVGEYLVNVNPLPYLYLPSDTIACANHIVTLTALTNEDVEYLWMPGGSTMPSIVVDTTGLGVGSHTWNVAVTGENGCIANAGVDLTFSECTGFDEYDLQSLRIYPNPSAGVFTIKTGEAIKGQYHITVLDASNNQVLGFSGVAANSKQSIEIDAGTLASGVYLLKLTTSAGTHAAKLIIRK